MSHSLSPEAMDGGQPVTAWPVTGRSFSLSPSGTAHTSPRRSILNHTQLPRTYCPLSNFKAIIDVLSPTFRRRSSNASFTSLSLKSALTRRGSTEGSTASAFAAENKYDIFTHQPKDVLIEALRDPHNIVQMNLGLYIYNRANLLLGAHEPFIRNIKELAEFLAQELKQDGYNERQACAQQLCEGIAQTIDIYAGCGATVKVIAGIKVKGKGGLTRVQYVHTCRESSGEVMTALIEAGLIDPRKTFWDTSPLILVARVGNLPVMMAILDAGSNVNQIGGKHDGGLTRLLASARSRMKASMKLLVKRGASIPDICTWPSSRVMYRFFKRAREKKED
ncbi:hypothetical protein K458DRAFT_429972 [Lentithecium fluviatile CBS 122367]|uniref:Uncharacterized protein n=1 Tax=Lentithecium fluviatile CBS 122367 TaxID=1168545 RepID=A0A6G1J749_9PLEO|nr:hypothetical protein K458DRAFT_429972 [Lentithecium fluviatile CBS 122367]